MSHVLKTVGHIIGITIFVSVIVGCVIGIYFVGFAGLFQLLGVTYHSIWALALFVISFFIIGFVIDLFVHPLVKILAEVLQNRYHVFFLRFAIDVSANWMILHVLNVIMDSITINVVTEIIIAVFLFLVEFMLDD